MVDVKGSVRIKDGEEAEPIRTKERDSKSKKKKD